MKGRRALALGFLALATAGCGQAAEIPVVAPRQPSAAQPQCAAQKNPVNTVFFAREADSSDLSGLDYFVREWGQRQHCFNGVLLTSLKGADLSPYQVMIVDVSHDAVLSAEDAAAIRAFIARGRRIGVFAWPLALKDRSIVPDPLAGLQAELGGVKFGVARDCGDWMYTDAPGAPFPIEQTSYRYENFGSAIFTLSLSGPQRPWANSLFCPGPPQPVMVESPAGIVAGFSVGYSISLADNNVRSVGMKRMLVDAISVLARPFQLG
ncbi:MAG: hypothetical protein NVSMB17_06780 [Candidatus Dormibacteria bacterium]